MEDKIAILQDASSRLLVAVHAVERAGGFTSIEDTYLDTRGDEPRLWVQYKPECCAMMLPLTVEDVLGRSGEQLRDDMEV